MRSFKTLQPWLRLVRLPNLLTLPGDPLAGFLLVATFTEQPLAWLRLLAACGATVCLYIFGLILNDLMDIETDRVERPERPLPAGEITLPQARMAAVAMVLSALNLGLAANRYTLYAATLVAFLIMLYNAFTKKLRVVGVVNMGLCRGGSLLLGAVAAGATQPVKELWPALLGGGALTLYVIGFSALAKREMEAQKPQGLVRWLPFAALLPLLPALLVVATKLRQPLPITPFIFIFLMVITLMRAWLLGGIMYRLQPVPATIGGHIRNLLLLQAALCAVAGAVGVLPAVGLVLLSLVFPHLAKRFYSS